MSSDSESESDNPCLDCGGMCCSFREMNIVWRTLEPGERYDSALLDAGVDSLVFEDGEVPDMDWYVSTDPDGERALAFECNHREDGLCTEYDRRPSMCSNFQCPALEGEISLEEFKTNHARDVDELPDVDDLELREVTDRVQEIIEREAAN